MEDGMFFLKIVPFFREFSGVEAKLKSGQGCWKKVQHVVPGMLLLEVLI